MVEGLVGQILSYSSGPVSQAATSPPHLRHLQGKVSVRE